MIMSTSSMTAARCRPGRLPPRTRRQANRIRPVPAPVASEVNA
ncbi:hypothetical protein I551_8290 [Mycobacterium ulcerans str. Harvey]|uniref:Uncharacterized protein n=1 Tax=Mycobacterium ulcerans str. Harvey TaxID=1299332 RepID=A0ABN0QKP6_MYCUL|nr:hypothetical protein I551_8290 [Mycobacterium ulcerans str. Harvey]